jgi:hypothetical protein
VWRLQAADDERLAGGAMPLTRWWGRQAWPARRTALARRYNASLTEIDAALGDLSRRSLVRRLPDGQLYRASPADYWIPVEGAGGLGTRLDPMGGTITCQTRHVSQREAPQDVAWALHLPSGAPIRVIRCV